MIKVFDRSQDGKATAVLVEEDGHVFIMYRDSSITQIRKHLGDYKRKHKLLGVKVETCLGESYQQHYGDNLDWHNGEPEKEEGKPMSRFSINERFNMVESVIQMLIDGHQDSLIISGSGGVGKTHSVLETLDKVGYKRIYPNDSAIEGKFYRHFSGGASPTELYKAMYDFNGETLVFDDFDSIFDKQTSINILKAALDSYERREITWISPVIERQNYPTSFEFTGKVIFISNLPLNKIPQPIQSRSLLLSLDFSLDDIVERMRKIGEKMIPYLNEEDLKEVIDWISENKQTIKDLSLRTLLKVSRFKSCSDNWKALSEYAN